MIQSIRQFIIALAIPLASILAMSAPVVAEEQSLEVTFEVFAITAATLIDDNGPTGWGFADLYPGTIDQGEQGQFPGNGALTVVVGAENNITIDLRARADNFIDDATPSHSMPAQSLKFGITNNNLEGVRLTTTYGDTMALLNPGDDQDIWMWLSIPSEQEPGNYHTTFYISTDRKI